MKATSPKMCETCGQPFSKRPRDSHAQYEVRRFCDHACAVKGRKYRMRVQITAGGCWEWTGPRDKDGYGRAQGGRSRRAHRVVYEDLVGPIPPGLQLDHLCHNRDPSCPGGRGCPHRACVNPAHLEPATPRQNQLRSSHTPSFLNSQKTHCPRDHAFDDANTYIDRTGRRHCRACVREGRLDPEIRDRRRKSTREAMARQRARKKAQAL